jgi:hypothetical protein
MKLNNTVEINQDNYLNKVLEDYYKGKPEFHRIKMLTEEFKASEVNFIIRKIIDSIENKLEIVDTREIDKSQGSIKNVENYFKFMAALNQMRYMDPTSPLIKELVNLDKNINNNSIKFKNAYNANNKIIMWFYQTLVMNLFYGVSLVIANTIQAVSKQKSLQIEVVATQADKLKIYNENYTFVNIRNFNKFFTSGKFDTLVKNKDIDKVIGEGVLDTIKDLTGIGPVGSSIVGFILKAGSLVFSVYAILFLIRRSIFYFFYIRKSLSDELRVVSEFLDLTSELNENKELSEKQSKAAKFFNKLAEKLKIKDKQTSNFSERSLKDNEENKTDYKEVEELL